MGGGPSSGSGGPGGRGGMIVGRGFDRGGGRGGSRGGGRFFSPPGNFTRRDPGEKVI